MNVYLVHSTALSRSIFIYVVLWPFPPYSSVYTVSFLWTPSRFPLTFMPCMYSCFISIHVLRGQFRLLYGWWGIRIIFPPSPFLFSFANHLPEYSLGEYFPGSQPFPCTIFSGSTACLLHAAGHWSVRYSVLMVWPLWWLRVPFHLGV